MSAADATIMSASGFPLLAFFVWKLLTNEAFLEFLGRLVENTFDVLVSMSDKRTRNVATLRRASGRAPQK